MFALARSDVEALNRLARALAKQGGRLAGPELDIGGRAYAVGDDVVRSVPTAASVSSTARGRL